MRQKVYRLDSVLLAIWVYSIVALVASVFVWTATAHAATLNWEPSAINEEGTNAPEGYRIYRDAFNTPVAEVGADVTSFDLGELYIGVQYSFGVSAFNASGESGILPLYIKWEEPSAPVPSRPGPAYVIGDPKQRAAAPTAPPVTPTN